MKKTTTLTTGTPHRGEVGQVLEEHTGIFYDIVGVPDQFTLEVVPFGFWRTIGWWLARRWDTVRGWLGRRPGAKTVDWDQP